MIPEVLGALPHINETRVVLSLDFCVVFSRSLFVFCPFSFWPFYVLLVSSLIFKMLLLEVVLPSFL